MSPMVKGAGCSTFYVAKSIPALIFFTFSVPREASGGVEYTVNVGATIHEIDGKDVFVDLVLFCFANSSCFCFVFYKLKSTFLHLFA